MEPVGAPPLVVAPPVRPPRPRAAGTPSPEDAVVPRTYEGPPTFAELRGEVDLRVRDLGRLVREAVPEVGPEVAAALGRVENLATALRPDDSAAVKVRLREAVWALRQALEAGPAEGRPPGVRAALEGLRGASLDNSWERSLGGYPSERHVIRPAVSAVPNFEEVNPGLLRGGQPDAEGVAWLADRGVRAEVDFRGDDRDNQWVAPAWGPIRRYSIPMRDYGAPTPEQVEEFGRILALESSPDHPLFIHCKAGVGRTGAMVACWRVTQGWSAEDAIARERFMSYDGSFRQEQFVRDFEGLWKARAEVSPPA